MLKEAFENVAPYISNIEVIKDFVNENEDRSDDEIIALLEKKIDESHGTLSTDFKILLNEFSKKLNMEM